MANEVKLRKVAEDAFGISVRRYQQLAREGIVPTPIDGSIDFVAAASALIEYYRKLAAGNGSLTLTDERTRLTRFQAELAKLELAAKRGELLSYESVRADWVRALSAMRSRLLSLPSKLAPLLFGKSASEINAAIEANIHQALNELSALSYAKRQEDTMARGAGDVTAAGEAHGKRVGRRAAGVKPRKQRRAR